MSNTTRITASAFRDLLSAASAARDSLVSCVGLAEIEREAATLARVTAELQAATLIRRNAELERQRVNMLATIARTTEFRMAQVEEIRARERATAGGVDCMITLSDRGRGKISIALRDGVVVGAMGSEPERFMGLTEPQARALADKGGR